MLIYGNFNKSYDKKIPSNNYISISIISKKENNLKIEEKIEKKTEEKKIIKKRQKMGFVKDKKVKINNLPVEVLKEKSTSTNNKLNDFYPNSAFQSELREEGSNSFSKENTIQSSNDIQEKSYPFVLDFSESVKKNYIHIPGILRKPFQAAKVSAKIIRLKDGNWKIVNINSKNPYFRAFFYEEIQKMIQDKYLVQSLISSNLKLVELNLIYTKLKSVEDPSIDTKVTISKNQVFFYIDEKIKPEEYALIAGGINILGIGAYALDKMLPDSYQNSSYILELKKSFAFENEGAIN